MHACPGAAHQNCTDGQAGVPAAARSLLHAAVDLARWRSNGLAGLIFGKLISLQIIHHKDYARQA